MKRLTTNGHKIVKENGLPAGALKTTGPVFEGKSNAEKFEALWQAFCDSVEWRAEEAAIMDALQAELAELKKTVDRLTRDSMVRTMCHEMVETNRTSVFRDDNETNGQAGE